MAYVRLGVSLFPYILQSATQTPPFRHPNATHGKRVSQNLTAWQKLDGSMAFLRKRGKKYSLSFK